MATRSDYGLQTKQVSAWIPSQICTQFRSNMAVFDRLTVFDGRGGFFSDTVSSLELPCWFQFCEGKMLMAEADCLWREKRPSDQDVVVYHDILSI